MVSTRSSSTNDQSALTSDPQKNDNKNHTRQSKRSINKITPSEGSHSNNNNSNSRVKRSKRAHSNSTADPPSSLLKKSKKADNDNKEETTDAITTCAKPSYFRGYVDTFFEWSPDSTLIKRILPKSSLSRKRRRQLQLLHSGDDASSSSSLLKSTCEKTTKSRSQSSVVTIAPIATTTSSSTTRERNNAIPSYAISDSRAWWKQVHLGGTNAKNMQDARAYNWDFLHLCEVFGYGNDPLSIQQKNVFIFGVIENERVKIKGVLRCVPAFVVVVTDLEEPSIVVKHANSKNGVTVEEHFELRKEKLEWKQMNRVNGANKICILYSNQRRLKSNELEGESASPLFLRPSELLEETTVHLNFNEINMTFDRVKDQVDQWTKQQAKLHKLKKSDLKALVDIVKEKIHSIDHRQKLRKTLIDAMSEDQRRSADEARYYKFYPRMEQELEEGAEDVKSFPRTTNITGLGKAHQIFDNMNWEPIDALFCRQSRFNTRVVVLNTQLDNETVWRELQFGYKQYVQGRIRLKKNLDLDHSGRCGYIDSMATAGMAFLKAFKSPSAKKVFPKSSHARLLFAGLGVGALPNIFIRLFPHVIIDVVEIDPVVAEAAEELFGFDTEKANLFIEDINDFLVNSVDKNTKYDAIFMDVADENGLPKELVTPQFLEKLSSIMTPQSAMITNVFLHRKRDFNSVLHIFEESFQSVHWLACSECVNNHIVVSYNAEAIPEDDVITKNLNVSEDFDYNYWDVLDYGIKKGKLASSGEDEEEDQSETAN